MGDGDALRMDGGSAVGHPRGRVFLGYDAHDRPFYLTAHGSTMPAVHVDTAQLRGWAGQAHTAAEGLHAGLVHARRAQRDLDDAGQGLRTTAAAVRAVSQWSGMLSGLRDAVDGYGTKLATAADAYDAHDTGAADQFAPARATPVQHPGGGPVAG